MCQESWLPGDIYVTICIRLQVRVYGRVNVRIGWINIRIRGKTYAIIHVRINVSMYWVIIYIRRFLLRWEWIYPYEFVLFGLKSQCFQVKNPTFVLLKSLCSAAFFSGSIPNILLDLDFCSWNPHFRMAPSHHIPPFWRVHHRPFLRHFLGRYDLADELVSNTTPEAAMAQW
jgi:hypothetical protein